MVYRKEVAENLQVCPECNHHFRIGARKRIEQLTDTDSFEELFDDITTADALQFQWGGKTYTDRTPPTPCSSSGEERHTPIALHVSNKLRATPRQC
jgi:acetyl-CoA carboxylase beta subunit